MRAAELTDDPDDDCSTVTLLVPEVALDELERIQAAYGAEIVAAHSLKPQADGYIFEVRCLHPWSANSLLMDWLGFPEARKFSAECQKRQSGATSRSQ